MPHPWERPAPRLTMSSALYCSYWLGIFHLRLCTAPIYINMRDGEPRLYHFRFERLQLNAGCVWDACWLWLAAMRPWATLRAMWKRLIAGNAALHHILLPGCGNKHRWTLWLLPTLVLKNTLSSRCPFSFSFFSFLMYQKPVTSLQFLFLYVSPSAALPLACIDRNKGLVQGRPVPWYPPTASLNYPL